MILGLSICAEKLDATAESTGSFDFFGHFLIFPDKGSERVPELPVRGLRGP